MTGTALLLLGTGVAGAAQTQLPGATIPKFVEPLPFLTEFEILNAMSVANGGLGGTPFPVNAEEFEAQILPTLANWPTAPATCFINDPDPTTTADEVTPGTASWTYGYISNPATLTGAPRPTYLGPVVIAQRGVAANPTYGNNIPDASLGSMGVVQYNMPIDKTLDWADPQMNTGPVDCYTGGFLTADCQAQYPFYSGPMPIATHLHGGEVSALYDGGPDAWFTPGAASHGPGYPSPGSPTTTYHYPNEQQESLIWFHDHALGITRLNVFAGLAGIQPIIDPANTPKDALGNFLLPQLADGYHVPLILQDRTFDTNCEIYYNLFSNPQPNPLVHPNWIPEFIGDTIVVNGKTWPFFNVEPRQYRFSFVNGSNSRFYELTIKSADDPVTGYIGMKLPMLVIATDDGYLMNAVSTNMLVIGPGERYEVVVDFKGLPPNNMPVMFNSARTPYPGGGAVVKKLTDTVMQFRVQPTASAVPDTAVVAGTPLRDPVTNPIQPIITAHDPLTGSITRQLTLNEAASALGPLELIVNNSKFNLDLITPGCPFGAPSCRETELPAAGDTEIWEIINISADAHPMHTHLTSFQVINRQAFKAAQYLAAYDGARFANGKADGAGPPYDYSTANMDGAIGGNPSIGPFLKGRPKAPNAYEMGWKDVVIAYPGEVTRIVVRWDTTDTPPAAVPAAAVGTENYPFDPTTLIGGVGYVWHCHIVDHEDNEMMRNYVVGTARQPVTAGGTW